MAAKNVTISLDTELLRAARRYAKARNLSVNGVIRRFLESAVTPAADEKSVDEFFAALDEAAGASEGRRWKREDAYDR